MTREQILRKIDQAYECAGLAAQDGDIIDVDRWYVEVERLKRLLDS